MAQIAKGTAVGAAKTSKSEGKVAAENVSLLITTYSNATSQGKDKDGKEGVKYQWLDVEVDQRDPKHGGQTTPSLMTRKTEQGYSNGVPYTNEEFQAISDIAAAGGKKRIEKLEGGQLRMTMAVSAPLVTTGIPNAARSKDGQTAWDRGLKIDTNNLQRVTASEFDLDDKTFENQIAATKLAKGKAQEDPGTAMKEAKSPVQDPWEK